MQVTETKRGMTKDEKKAAIDYAWARYRAASQAIPRTLPFSSFKRNGKREDGFLERDDALFKAYLATERGILAERDAA